MSLLYFKERSKTAELMDDFKSDKIKLYKTIKQFLVLNMVFSRSRHLIKKFIIPEIKKDKSKTYTFLDIGAGGGDIVFWLEKLCQKRNYKVNFFCLDYDKRIIDYLKDEIKKRKLKNIKIIFNSVFNLDKIGKFDFVFSNHFLHHFYDKDIITVIKKFRNTSKKVFLINDIIRSKFIYIMHIFIGIIFLRKTFALQDGMISIQKGFIPKELSLDAKQVDKNIIIGRLFPIRVYLYYKKNA